MSDNLIQRINEATNYKILRNLRWEEVIHQVLNMYDFAKRLSVDERNKKAKAAFTNAGKMIDNLQKLVDMIPGQEKFNDAAQKEDNRLRKISTDALNRF